MTSRLSVHPSLLKDKKIRALIQKYGPPDLTTYHGTMGAFEALVRSIVYQQLSGKAAATIHNRLLALFPRKRLTPKALLPQSDDALRAVGLSHAKVSYIKDLAKKFADGSVPYRSFRAMKSEDIFEHLIKVKGVGEWTVHMFLIFTLHRHDVLPVGDLAIRKGFQRVYGLADLPTRKEMEALAKPWRSQASIASWYLWKVMDDEKEA